MNSVKTKGGFCMSGIDTFRNNLPFVETWVVLSVFFGISDD